MMKVPFIHRTGVASIGFVRLAVPLLRRNRYRSVQCMEYLGGIPAVTQLNGTSCWEQLEDTTSRANLREGPCRHIKCLAMYLDVSVPSGLRSLSFNFYPLKILHVLCCYYAEP